MVVTPFNVLMGLVAIPAAYFAIKYYTERIVPRQDAAKVDARSLELLDAAQRGSRFAVDSLAQDYFKVTDVRNQTPTSDIAQRLGKSRELDHIRFNNPTY